MSQQAVQLTRLSVRKPIVCAARSKALQLQIESEKSTVREAGLAPIVSTGVHGRYSRNFGTCGPITGSQPGWAAFVNVCRYRIHSFHEKQLHQKLCRENRRQLTLNWIAESGTQEATLRLA